MNRLTDKLLAYPQGKGGMSPMYVVPVEVPLTFAEIARVELVLKTRTGNRYCYVYEDGKNAVFEKDWNVG
jgi:hypothetical protein